MILLWGLPDDSPLRAAYAALMEAGASVSLINQFDVARSAIVLDGEGGGTLTADGARYDLGAVGALYLRPFESARVLSAAGDGNDTIALHATRFDDTFLLWSETAAATVVNLPSAMASNGSKPMQATMIAAAGFDVPRTLLTSDAAAAAEFRATHGKAIYKSMSGVRSRVTLLDDAAIERLGAAAHPLQLQEHIDGADHRVHVVGGELFACHIESDATDYRYPGDSGDVRIEDCSLPPAIAERAFALSRELRLAFCGIDLRLAADGRWVCFEVNPSPGFTYYENATGAPIARALAKLLMHKA